MTVQSVSRPADSSFEDRDRYRRLGLNDFLIVAVLAFGMSAWSVFLWVEFCAVYASLAR